MESAVLQAVSSPRRREILRLIWKRELSAGDIHRAMHDVSFGAVSLHLRTLQQTGLVRVRAQHRYRFYRAHRDAFGSLSRLLESMWDDALWNLKIAAELEQSRRGPARKSQ